MLFKAFAHYKRSDETGVNQVRTLQRKLSANGQDFPDRYYGIFECIEMLMNRKKSEMKTFGSKLKPYRYEQVNHYNRIAKLLEDEYIVYLKETGQYIEVLDM